MDRGHSEAITQRLNYFKCFQCRHAKQKCLPVDRTWPLQKCDRCAIHNYPCSPSMTANQERHLHQNPLADAFVPGPSNQDQSEARVGVNGESGSTPYQIPGSIPAELTAVSFSHEDTAKSLLPKAQALHDLHVTKSPNIFRQNPSISYVLEGLEHEAVAEHCKQKITAIEKARQTKGHLNRARKLEEHTRTIRELRETFENSQDLKIADVTELISILSKDIAECKDWDDL